MASLIKRSVPTLLLLASACDRGSSALIAPADLQGTAWTIVEMSDGTPLFRPESCPVTLSFVHEGSFGGRGVINNYGAFYRVVDGMIVASGINADMMGASDTRVTASEAAYFGVFRKPFALRPVAKGAELVDADGKVQLRLKPHSGEACADAR